MEKSKCSLMPSNLNIAHYQPKGFCNLYTVWKFNDFSSYWILRDFTEKFSGGKLSFSYFHKKCKASFTTDRDVILKLNFLNEKIQV